MCKINTLADLKTVIASPAWFEALQAQAEWFPRLAATLPWTTRLSQHILLHYYIDVNDETDPLFDRLLDEMEQIYTELIAFFELAPQSKQEQLIQQTRLALFFIKTETSRVFGSLTDPHLLFYFWDTKQHPYYLQKLRHEMAHWVWSRLYGEAPPLFQEGVAVLAEEWSRPAQQDKTFLSDCPTNLANIPPLHELAMTETFWKQKTPYGVGGQFVAYLVGQWGWEPLKRLFLLSSYEDPAILDHFQQIYGRELAAVDREWRVFLHSLLPSVSG